MTTTAQTAINIVIYSSHLTDELIPADDLRQSAEAFAAEVRGAVADEYPTAAITVTVKHNVSGVGSGVTVEADDYEAADRMKAAIERTMENIHGAGRFWV